MSEMKFSEEHEWIRLDGDIGTVGITDYAQAQLGDVVYVELPDIGKAVTGQAGPGTEVKLMVRGQARAGEVAALPFVPPRYYRG